MPKTTSEDLLSLSVRIPPAIAKQVEGIAERQGLSVNRIMRRMVEDALNLMGLPGPIAETLHKDIRALGLDAEDPRDYYVYLLTCRYRDLLTGAVSSEPKRLTRK